LEKHLAARCPGLDDLQFPLSCPFCQKECEGRKELSKHSLTCFSWEQDGASDEQFLDEFDKEINRVTRLPTTSQFITQMFEKAELRLSNGEREFALIIPRGTKRLLSGSMAHVHLVKRPALQVVKDDQFDSALKTYAFGGLVSIQEYKRLETDDPLWHLPFADNGELLATVFEGVLIQSGHEILYALKVEGYGTADFEDPHSQDLAKPVGKSTFTIENVFHDQTHKVMIGGIKWCILVTMAVLLDDGTVIVGPDNNVFHPSTKSFVLMKKNAYDSVEKPVKTLYNTMARLVRSKYDEDATLAPYSAVNVLLNHVSTMPVTLGTLYSFKTKNAWSGIKVAAFIFHQLHRKRKIVKADVQAKMDEALIARAGKSCERLAIIDKMVQVLKDVEQFPVSKSVNKCLTELAGTLSGEITNLNDTVVREVVIKRLKSMLSQ
ncbi:hypothetical protein BGZ83_002444, partial [Gryganskiella cystojenkinii]